MIDNLLLWFSNQSAGDLAWLALGFFAQTMFSMRFVIQWVASERVKRSIVPETFWYFSMAGGVLLLAYAIKRADPVFILGQALGVVIYARNIYFIWTHKQAGRDDAAGASS